MSPLTAHNAECGGMFANLRGKPMKMNYREAETPFAASTGMYRLYNWCTIPSPLLCNGRSYSLDRNWNHNRVNTPIRNNGLHFADRKQTPEWRASAKYESDLPKQRAQREYISASPLPRAGQRWMVVHGYIHGRHFHNMS